MAKLSMKDYENFLEEEARQDRLQEELEYQRYEETYDAEENWRDYQRKQEEERRWEALNSYPEYDSYFDEDDFVDDDCMADLLDAGVPEDDFEGDDGFDSENVDPLDEELLYGMQEAEEDSVEGRRIYKKSVVRNQQEDRICRKAIARNRHLSKINAKKSKAQKANYVAKREMRKCCKLYRNLDKAYLQLANKAYSDGYLPYSMCQNMERRVNANLDQMSDIVLKAHYFECILGAPMYKQALYAPKAM